MFKINIFFYHNLILFSEKGQKLSNHSHKNGKICYCDYDENHSLTLHIVEIFRDSTLTKIIGIGLEKS